MRQDILKWKLGKEQFIQNCVDRFGSMNKNDYEVALFHLMLENGYSEKSDYAISKELQIPETKVKRLRYEANLAYPKSDDEIKQEFYSLLQTRSYKLTHDGKIQFAVNDKMLRLYLNDMLNENGSFYDSSFNTSIVTISAADLLILLSCFEKKDEIIKHVKEEVKKHGMLLPKSLSEKTKDLFIAFLKDMGSKISENMTNYIIDSLNK